MINYGRLVPKAPFAARVLFLSLLVALSACSRPPDVPNIVFIYTDDQSVDTMDYMPRLKDLVANQGLTFNNSFVDFSLCSPSRASFFTGMSSHNTGLVGNGDEGWGGYELFKPLEDKALAVRLHEAGYQTGFFGKYMNSYAKVVPPGWDRWVAYSGAASQYDYRLSIDGKTKKMGSAPEDYGDDVISTEAIDWIRDTSASRPFFAMISTKSPHEPNRPPPRHDGSFADLPLPRPPNFNEADVSDKPPFARLPLLDEAGIAEVETAFQKRQEQLKGIEDTVEQVVEVLRDMGRLDNTIIIYSSDNGFSMGEHRRPRNKALLYDEIARVPLIIRGPGIPKGETRDQLVNNLDLTASILSWAKATSGYTLDGRPLGPIVADDAAPWRTHLLSHGFSSDILKPTIAFDINRFTAVRTPRWVFAQHKLENDQTVEELYDMSTDPWQLDNLSGNPAYASVADALRQSLEKLRDCKGDACWDDSPDPVAPSETAAIAP
jgi:arylsulfatase A-like enzyme